MHSNLAYFLVYVPPPRRGLVIINSNSPLSLLVILDSLVDSSDPIYRKRELVSPHVSADLSLEGINKFRTNVF